MRNFHLRGNFSKLINFYANIPARKQNSTLDATIFENRTLEFDFYISGKKMDG